MRLRRLVLLTMAGFLVAGVAQAGNITASFTGGPGISAYYGGTGGAGGQGVSTRAGDFLITVTQATPGGLDVLPSSFYTFCVDLQHYSAASNTASLQSMASWNLLGGASDEQRLGASYLARRYFDLYPAGASDELAAAYQVAIWELLYEREEPTSSFLGWNVEGGSTYFTGTSSASLMGAAENLIHQIDTQSPLYGYAGLLHTEDYYDQYGRPYAQEYIAPVPDGGATLVLLGGVLLGLGAFRRMFRA